MGLTDQSSQYYDSFTNLGIILIDGAAMQYIYSNKKEPKLTCLLLLKKTISKVISEVWVAQNAIKAITLHYICKLFCSYIELCIALINKILQL